jgi:hypothetical protein
MMEKIDRFLGSKWRRFKFKFREAVISALSGDPRTRHKRLRRNLDEEVGLVKRKSPFFQMVKRFLFLSHSGRK